MTTTATPDVPLPAGAEADVWDDGGRTIRGPLRGVDGYDLIVWTAAEQFADGSIDVDGEVEAPNVLVENHAARGMTSDQARELAAVLIEAADEIDGWAAK
jgi:hypothetical protein